jgi:hypothetical protein
MHNHKATVLAFSAICVLLAACTFPGTNPATPTPFLLPTFTLAPATNTPVPSLTPLAVPTLPVVAADPTAGLGTAVFVTRPAPQQPQATQPSSAAFCADAQATTLINSFKSALQTGNGAALAALVSPAHGMEARLYRNGRIVNYDQQHAKFLFDSTFSVDWGAAPGSGQMTSGSFHQVFIPDLLDVFGKDYALACNEVKVGGASYPTTWPYPGINFYSAHYPGTAANGNMDWHTWLLGMQYVNSRPYLYAIMQFKWEP